MTFNHKIVNSLFIKDAALPCLLVLLVQYFSSTNIIFGTYLLIIIGLIILLLNTRLGFLFYFVVIFASDDFSLTGIGLETEFSSSNIFNVALFGFNLSIFWTTAVFTKLFLYSYHNRSMIYLPRSLFYFLILLASGAFIGLANFNRYYISDMGFFLYSTIGVLGASYFVNNSNFIKYFYIVLYMYLTKITWLIISSILLLNGPELIYTFKYESGLYLTLVFFVFSVIILTHKSQVPKLLGLISLILLVTINILSPARSRILLLLVSLILVFLKTKRVFLSSVVCLAIYSLYFFTSQYYETLYQYLIWKISSFSPSTEASTSSYVRFKEMQNILAMHFDNLITLPFGTGFGGNFTADYFPFQVNLFGESAYPDEWLRTGIFYKPHGPLLYLLLKYGVISTCIYYYIIFKSATTAYTKSKQFLTSASNSIYLSLAIAVPMLSLISFTPKLQFITGICLSRLVLFGEKKQIHESCNFSY